MPVHGDSEEVIITGQNASFGRTVDFDLELGRKQEREQAYGPPVAKALNPEDCVDGANREHAID